MAHVHITDSNGAAHGGCDVVGKITLPDTRVEQTLATPNPPELCNACMGALGRVRGRNKQLFGKDPNRLAAAFTPPKKG